MREFRRNAKPRTYKFLEIICTQSKMLLSSSVNNLFPFAQLLRHFVLSDCKVLTLLYSITAKSATVGNSFGINGLGRTSSHVSSEHLTYSSQ
ncbi:unnamed protein product [Rhizophagus irregularis]|nr:unnamed protein product [Rhizophagus irregularis]